MSEYRAFVREEWELQRVRLLVAARDQLLMSDGTWHSHGPEETVPPDAGLVFPTAAVPALLDALRAFCGERGPTEGEVRVLREWLAHERSRVDALLPPRNAPAEKRTSRLAR